MNSHCDMVGSKFNFITLTFIYLLHNMVLSAAILKLQCLNMHKNCMKKYLSSEKLWKLWLPLAASLWHKRAGSSKN